MHIGWLYCDQGAEARRILQDELRNQPRINKAIVCINKDPLAAALFTPARHIDNTLDIGGLFSVAGLRASGKELNAFIQESFCHVNPLRPFDQNPTRALLLCFTETANYNRPRSSWEDTLSGQS